MMTTEKTIDLHMLAAAIAAELGNGWSYNETPNENGDLWHFATIDHESGRSIHLHHGAAYRASTRGRLEISGTYPEIRRADGSRQTFFPSQLWDPKEPNPDISVSGEKTPAQIARDITRRFLPEYDRIWARLKARADATANYENEKASARDACAALPGVVMSEAKSGREFYGYVKFEGNTRQRADIRINSADSIELKIDGLDPAKLAVIVDLLRTL